MIKLDHGGEEFVFENEWDTAVPITIRKKDGEEPIIEVFPTYEKEAEEFIKLYGDDPFTKEALSFLWENIGEKMRKRGYEEDGGTNSREKIRERYYYTYVLKSPDEVKRDVILPTTLPLSKKNIRGTKNMTTFDLPLYIEEEMISFITVEDKKVLSIASENTSCSEDFDDEDMPVVEIGVETHKDYRGKGYAASNAASLCLELLKDNDCYVTYETANDNVSSQKCAEKVGFKRYGRCYYYVMRRK